MATCKVCKRNIQIGTLTCPYCGIVNPCEIKNSWNTASISLSVGIAFILVFYLWNTVQNPSISTSIVKDERKDSCKSELDCWGEKNRIAAEVNCKNNIVALSQFSAHWTNGFNAPLFSHFRWLDKNRETITYLGDKIEFRNEMGTYQNFVYECDFDPLSFKVLNVRLKPGMLSN